jgi:formylglycine-generating enzyme required for sulfatase activity
MRLRPLLIAAVLAALSPLPAGAEPMAGTEWRDPTTGIVFVWVPGGRYTMGCGAWAEPCLSAEKPAHTVTLGGFWLGKTEVTQAQWAKLMDTNPSVLKRGGDYPVDQVTWEDAHAFIDKLNRGGRGGFRLPSEAEWEYACREGGKDITLCGQGTIDQLGWFISNAKMATHPVGGKAANALGLVDMSGNLHEWTEDCWAETLEAAPADGTPRKDGECASHALRGGSWGNYPAALRSVARRSDFDVKCPFTGLRLVRSGDR